MNLRTWEFTGGPFHFGRRGLGQEVTAAHFSSDSLFAALVSRLAVLEGDSAVENWVRPFVEIQPPFLLTSLFPRVRNVRFFPAPVAKSIGEMDNLQQNDSLKDLKRVAFLSERLFLRVINGESLQSVLPSAVKLQGGALLAEPAEAKGLPEVIWVEAKRPRVTLDRLSQASVLFFTGQIHFSEGCGLWAGANVLDDSCTDKLDFLLHELGEAGLGAERSMGMGHCTVEKGADVVLPDPVDGTMMVTLGRFLPREGEIPSLMVKGAAYKLEKIGGWVTSPEEMNQRRRTVHMLVEGSVIGFLPGTPGDLVDVRPVYDGTSGLSHPVWRYGMPVCARFLPGGKGEI